VPKKIRGRTDCNGQTLAASVTIIRGAEFNASGRRRIAGWLRREARFLEKHADRMAYIDRGDDGWKPVRDLINDVGALIVVDGRVIACRVGKSVRRLDGVTATRRCIDGKTYNGEPALMSRWRFRLPDLTAARKSGDLDTCRRILSEAP